MREATARLEGWIAGWMTSSNFKAVRSCPWCLVHEEADWRLGVAWLLMRDGLTPPWLGGGLLLGKAKPPGSPIEGWP